MSLASDVARHVPFLRRYARALTGSQVEGDGHVRATLEALVAAPERLGRSFSTRVALYRIFQDVWADRPCSSRDFSSRGGFIAERLDHLGLTQRQALLLATMEGFSARETAEILGRGVSEVEEMIAAAVGALTALPSTTALVIEDEPLISLELCSIVTGMGHAVSAVAATARDAVLAARAKKPGFILADIQLADGSSGIDAVREIMALFNVPVIFITAFPERLLTGEHPEPTFVVTKPFAPENVKGTIGHALLMAAESGIRAA